MFLDLLFPLSLSDLPHPITVLACLLPLSWHFCIGVNMKPACKLSLMNKKQIWGWPDDLFPLPPNSLFRNSEERKMIRFTVE